MGFQVHRQRNVAYVSCDRVAGKSGAETARIEPSHDDIGYFVAWSLVDDVQAGHDPRYFIQPDQSLLSDRGSVDRCDVERHVLD